jgi:phage protein D
MPAGAGYTLLVSMAPAADAVVDAIQVIDIETSLEEASVLRLRLGISATEEGDWSVVDDDLFRPLVPLQLRLQRGAGAPEALINALVAQQRVSYAEGGGSTLEVTAFDATHSMNLEEKVKAWANMPDGTIATLIFGEHGLVPRADSTSAVLTDPEGTTIQRGTDIRFLRRLARRNGFDCYVQPEPLTGLDFGHFRRRELTGMPQAVLSVEMGDESNVQDLTIRYDLTRATAVKANGVDALQNDAQPVETTSPAEQSLGREGTLGRLSPTPTILLAGTGLPCSAELQTAAQAIVDRSAWSIVAEGTVGLDVGVLRPGGLISIRGAGRLYNGSYFVTRVHTTISAGSVEQRFEAARNAVAETGTELYLEVA